LNGIIIVTVQSFAWTVTILLWERHGEESMSNSNCDECAYNVYDDEDECYYCEADMDEDDMVRMTQGHYKSCPYYRNGDEYAVVRHQI
jgi:hypothetical protein